MPMPVMPGALVADVAKVAADGARLGVADRAAGATVGVEGDGVPLGLREAAVVARFPLPKEGLPIGLVDAGRVAVLGDATPPVKMPRLILNAKTWVSA